MYSNHNLRSTLQEWKNRLYRSQYEQFAHQIKYFRNNLSANKQLTGIMAESVSQYPLTREAYDALGDYFRMDDMSFQNEAHHAAFCLQFIDHTNEQEGGSYDLHNLNMFMSSQFSDTRENVIEQLISPIIYYLHDRLDSSNSTVYLLEKYKRRTEWFTCAELTAKYRGATKGYEDILETDLRQFLFDQGIDYPFSTPKSPSGRGDVIGAIDTADPIVIEIKIIDAQKSYGKQRLLSGLSQAIKYCNDYNKDVGYVVIYNFDAAEINFVMTEPTKMFPPMLVFNNKRFFFVTINMNQETSASKIGTTTSLDITEAELTKALES